MTETKRNVDVFDMDAATSGGYLYTSQSRLSSRLANARISSAVLSSVDFRNQRVVDIGCGDGSYTVEIASQGARHVTGLDPAAVAIEKGRERARALGLENCSFETHSIYDVPSSLDETFDVAVLRGVLHHLSDPAQAVAIALRLAKCAVILEPNGLNPVLKLIERTSRYHIEHEEQSFTPRSAASWCREGGARSVRWSFLGLVPFFCPDWMAKTGRLAEPVVEKIPGLRAISCGQYVMVAER
ncbi:class I SAM-dependent methyltransferase [Dyella sp. EPa41]|uniref:class I SAM-dependent methyltransferase n=1 Tax=Dyella sp. EPa41 TaxID=1561194 RepID=UPI00191563D8|nr:class I SAM-dependent methyltransferase [Dyella sp. EPa41]